MIMTINLTPPPLSIMRMLSAPLRGVFGLNLPNLRLCVGNGLCKGFDFLLHGVKQSYGGLITLFHIIRHAKKCLAGGMSEIDKFLFQLAKSFDQALGNITFGLYESLLSFKYFLQLRYAAFQICIEHLKSPLGMVDNSTVESRAVGAMGHGVAPAARSGVPT